MLTQWRTAPSLSSGSQLDSYKAEKVREGWFLRTSPKDKTENQEIAQGHMRVLWQKTNKQTSLPAKNNISLIQKSKDRWQQQRQFLFCWSRYQICCLFCLLAYSLKELHHISVSCPDSEALVTSNLILRTSQDINWWGWRPDPMANMNTWQDIPFTKDCQQLPDVTTPLRNSLWRGVCAWYCSYR